MQKMYFLTDTIHSISDAHLSDRGVERRIAGRHSEPVSGVAGLIALDEIGIPV